MEEGIWESSSADRGDAPKYRTITKISSTILAGFSLFGA